MYEMKTHQDSVDDYHAHKIDPVYPSNEDQQNLMSYQYYGNSNYPVL